MRITVIGGAGKMGCISAQHLAGDDRVSEVVIADPNAEQAKVVAEAIHSPKVRIHVIDPGDPQAFEHALQGSQAAVNATIRHFNLPVMRACLKTGSHYTDMGGLFFLTYKQLELHEQFKAAGLSAVLGMGSAPGMPNLQARYAAERLDTIESIKIYDGILPPATNAPRFSYSVPTIIDELTDEPMVFRDGKFQACPPLSEFEDYWFVQPLGLLPMHLSLHSEVATLPLTYKDKGISECFFKINYWGMAKEVVEKVRVLAEFGLGSREQVEVDGVKVVPRDLMVALLEEYVPPITTFLEPATRKPPDWAKEIVTEVKGTKDGKPVTYRMGTVTTKGHQPTGSAPAQTGIWLAEGRVPPGVYPPEVALDPVPFWKELESKEIFTQVTVTERV